MREELYIITSVCENRITDQRLALKGRVPTEVTALLRNYAEKQELVEAVEQIDQGDTDGMDGYELGINLDFDEQGHFSAYCYIDENFDIYARPMPEGPNLSS